MKIFLFPGQGSQETGMGEDLFDKIPEFYQNEEQINHILGYSVRDLCLNNPDNLLMKTQYTQPCLYIVNALHYFDRVANNETSEFFAGHSLGEYNALMAAGVFDFLTGLRLVKKRGELMGKANNGGMAAVIGLTSEQVEAAINSGSLHGIDVANYNGMTQTVISGPLDEIDKGLSVFDELGARAYVPLPVSAAFHSRYMMDAAHEFEGFLHDFHFKPLNSRVMSNVSGDPYPIDVTSAEIKSSLVKQITQSVRWTDNVRYLMAYDSPEFVEVGPGGVLTRMVHFIQKEAPARDIAAQNLQPSIEQKRMKVSQIHKEVNTPPSNITPSSIHASAASLGNSEFKKDFNIKYAYLGGAMYKGIASEDMVVAFGKAGMLGFFGSGGIKLDKLEETICSIKSRLNQGESYGMNLLSDISRPELEEQTVDLFLKHDVKFIEAAAYMQISSPLVRYRLDGIYEAADGSIQGGNTILAKISRPEVAEAFMSPAPEEILAELLSQGKITHEQARLARKIPISGDICVEADSGGHTDQGVAYALMPAMLQLRNTLVQRYGYKKQIRIGAAGGISTPEAAAAAFILGADFILTGSINQCSVEAGTSDAVKEILSHVNVQDTTYAPAGDLFELGAKVQVLKRGLFFPARANKLYDLYQKYDSLEDIDLKTRQQIQEKYFRRSFEEVYQETENYYLRVNPEEIERARVNPKHKMALIFKWYFVHSTRLAMRGDSTQKVDYQIHCGPAMGAFNQWVKGTELEPWRNRRVADMGVKIMDGAAELFKDHLNKFFAA